MFLRVFFKLNIFLYIIVAALIVEYGLERIASALDIKRQGARLPDEFKSFYDDEKYLLSKQYLKAITNFKHLFSTFSQRGEQK